jgi:hypothetical protein
MRSPPMLDVLHGPLAGKRPGDCRLSAPVEVSRGPRDPGHCVMPLSLALGRTLAAIAVDVDRQITSAALRVSNDIFGRTHADLLHEASEVPHVVYRITHGRDDGWASFRADWLIDHSTFKALGPDLCGGAHRALIIYGDLSSSRTT